jgi:hypothetical protein
VIRTTPDSREILFSLKHSWMRSLELYAGIHMKVFDFHRLLAKRFQDALHEPHSMLRRVLMPHRLWVYIPKIK